MATQPQPRPKGWQQNDLAQYFEAAASNRAATFANHRDEFELLSRIDGCFRKVAKDWLNPQNELSAALFLISHRYFMASSEHSCAGQIAESFAMSRACLEAAGYSLHVMANPSLGPVWIKRHDDDASKAAVRKEFSPDRIRRSIDQRNKKAAEIFQKLYERAIDFGAHPNERSLSSTLEIQDGGDRRFMTVSYLAPDEMPFLHALKSSAQVGVCALEILQEVFPSRFELLGVRHIILELRKGL